MDDARSGGVLDGRGGEEVVRERFLRFGGAGRGYFTSYILKRLELPVERHGEEPPRPKRSWTAQVAKPGSKQLAPRTQHWMLSLFMIYNETHMASIVTFSEIYIRPTYDP